MECFLTYNVACLVFIKRFSKGPRDIRIELCFAAMGCFIVMDNSVLLIMPWYSENVVYYSYICASSDFSRLCVGVHNSQPYNNNRDQIPSIKDVCRSSLNICKHANQHRCQHYSTGNFTLRDTVGTKIFKVIYFLDLTISWLSSASDVFSEI